MYLMYVNSNSKFIRLCGIVMYCIYIYTCVCMCLGLPVENIWAVKT